MERRWIVGCLGLLLAGCAQTRSNHYEPAGAAVPGDLGGLTPIAETINRSGDPSARRAGFRPGPTGPASPPVAPMSPIPPGRPAPFAGRASGSPRPQSPPRDRRADDTPDVERPAPFADGGPREPRPQSPPTTSVEPDPGPTTPLSPIPTSPPTADPSVSQAAAHEPPPTLARPDPARPTIAAGAGGTAANVGGEVITLTQLRAALKPQLDRLPPEQRNNPDIQRQVVDSVLSQLIERTVLVQAAKKQMKDPKAIQSFYEVVDKAWVEHEMPPMLREAKATDIHELKVKLAEKGISLDQIREEFRQSTFAREFMVQKLSSKMNVTLIEKQRYYREHFEDFNRPSQVVWREIAVDTAKCSGRDEAQRKAEALLARVTRGEDFARVAKAESHGATAREGGKWEIAPGSYAIPAVNEAIEALGPGGISRVIEAPAGFHVVKVESKREAGPAPFNEVQDQVRDLVARGKQAKLASAFIDDLKAKTLITTMFDGSPTGDPSAIRAGGSAETPR